MGRNNSDFLSGTESLKTEEREQQERVELIEIYLKMKQGVDTFQQRADEFKELVQI